MPDTNIIEGRCMLGGEQERFKISPLFVAITPGMIITDHDGVPA